MSLGPCEIFEVGPRDGLQNESRNIPVPDKVALIDRLSDAGFRRIEVASFVSPKAVPQMAGTGELLAQLPTVKGRHYSVLVPNMKGYELARAAGAETVAVVVSVRRVVALVLLVLDLGDLLSVALDLARRARHVPVPVVVAVGVLVPVEDVLELDERPL